MKHLITVLLVMAFILSALPVSAQIDNESNGDISELTLSTRTINTDYFEYSNTLTSPNAVKPVQLKKEGNFSMNAGDSVNFSFNTDGDYLYAVLIEYNAKDCKDELELSLKVDGKYLFDEMSSFKMPKIWTNNGEKRSDSIGNESAPEQKLWDGFTKQYISDSEGVELQPYKFQIAGGAHTLALNVLSGSVTIKQISLVSPEVAVDYKDYKQDNKAQNYKGKAIVIEGESAVYKTDKSIIPKADNSNPALSPSSYSKNLLNTIGFSSWNAPGEAVTWDFEVKQSGFYKIGFMFKQSESVNNTSYRKLFIDGKVPFSEAESVEFRYSNGWQYEEFASEEEEPYLIYLSSGSHTLTLEATLSHTADYYRRLEEIVNELGDIYIDISMITSESPDKQRDYDLFRQIPDLNERLEKNYKGLSDLSQEINESTGMSGSSMISALKNMARVLKSMIDNPYTAQTYLTDYYSNYTSVGGWLYDMKSMPLNLDRIILSSPEDKEQDIDVSFMEKMFFSIMRFFVSFSDDYNVLGTSGEDGSALTIWVNWGRDQAEILGNMIADDFTPKYGINVELEIVNAGIVKGILAGNPPDLSLHMARSEPVNLAMRGALYDLTQFDNYEEITSRFANTASVPYTYNGGVYALPDTQSFYIMYCRTDILDSLNIKTPKTWDEFIDATVTIQRNNMQVWLPYLKITTATTVNTGVGGLSLFPTLVHQNGLRMYNESGTACTLADEKILSVFETWTDFYTRYKLPKEASFYNRFRIGTIPLGVEQYTVYQTLVNAAPEIRDDWTIAEIPGVVEENGRINNAVAGSGTGCGIIKGTGNEEKAWKFLDWWTSAETQLKYSNSVETVLGTLGRVASANIEAVSDMSWKRQDLNVILSAWEKLEEVEEIPGSYYLTRAVDQAYWAVVNGTSTSKEALMIWSEFADNEIKRKIDEYSNE